VISFNKEHQLIAMCERSEHNPVLGTNKKVLHEDLKTFIKENNVITCMLLAPEKPGAFINRLRMEQVRKIRKSNKPAKEISQFTKYKKVH